MRSFLSKSTPALLAVLVAGAPCAAAADEAGICVNPHWSYEAHAIDAHNLRVKNTIGSSRPELELMTTCIDLKSAYRFTVSSEFSCLAMGDTVVAATIDGRVEVCRVSRVAPYQVPAPAQHS